MNLLEINWWYKNPVDFEHKKWTLMAYLKKMDESFYDKKFSPLLLHSETLLSDMILSKERIVDFTEDLTEKVIIFENNYIYNEIKKPEMGELRTYLNILDYSIPLLGNKIDFGWELWKDNPSILF
jgi:hypothetical protein|tara:strand:- start:1759 stop:2133 length:375 start_codon:yes stop_codon:yes gene_type:complete